MDYQCQSVSAVSVEGALTISGTHGGALFGDAAKVSYTDCTTDVTVNGTTCPYFSYQEKRMAET